MKALFTAFALSLFATPAMAQDDAAPETGSLAWHNNQQAALHALNPADGWSTLQGGIKFRRIAGDGSGSGPKVSDTVQVNYTGRFADGTIFDSNEGSAPITFPLARLIKGWQIGIPYMGVGDTAELAIPAEMAYGLQGGGPIPGGATLFFTIELVGVVQR